MVLDGEQRKARVAQLALEVHPGGIGALGDGIVMNERSDRFQIGTHTITLRVMGVFELADGKITHWRDYFDMNQYLAQLPQQES